MCIFIWPAIDAQGRARETREQAPAPLSRPNPLRGPTAKKVAGPEKNLGPLAPLSGPQATFRPLRGPSFCLARAKPAPSCPRLGTRPFGAPQVFPLEPYHSAFAWGQCAGGVPPAPLLAPPGPPRGAQKGPAPAGPLCGCGPWADCPRPWGHTYHTRAQGARLRGTFPLVERALLVVLSRPPRVVPAPPRGTCNKNNPTRAPCGALAPLLSM